jgi:hypothetical protein
MRRPSPALVVASVALFFSLGGVGLAASHYLITSTSQIKPSVLRELRGAKGPPGPQGPAGLQGATGSVGTAGSLNPATVTTVVGNDAVMCVLGGGNCDVGESTATCPAGDIVLGGGWIPEDNLPPVSATVGYNAAASATAWSVIMANDTTAVGADFAAFAVCAA